MPPKKAAATEKTVKSAKGKGETKGAVEEPEKKTRSTRQATVKAEETEVPEKKTRAARGKKEEPKEVKENGSSGEPKKGRKAKIDKIEEPEQEEPKKGRKGKLPVPKNDKPKEEEEDSAASLEPKKGRKGKLPVTKSDDPKEEEEDSATSLEPKKGRKGKLPVTKSDDPKEEEKDSVTSTEPQKGRKGKPPAPNNEKAGSSDEPKKGRKRKSPTPQNKEAEAPTKAPKNATSTDWNSVNFKCTAKNSSGQSPNFHITSWNVDGLRAWLKKGGSEIITYDNPDIFCIQETKCSLDKLPDEIKTIDGYEMYWCTSHKEGYAGVGVASKIKPIDIKYGIGSDEHDDEGRCITLEYENFFLVNVYVPNAGRGLVTLPKRLDWNELFKTFVKDLDQKKPVIICGDMNVAHEEKDLANPKANKKNAGFTQEERDGLTDFLAAGYVDSFRQLYPEKEKAYTFWTFMANARSKNVGWRLDYFIVSSRLMPQVCDNIIHSDVLGSDHCPLSLHLSL